MLFNSITFFCFFVVFIFLYRVASRNHQYQNILVLIGSFIFYGWWDWRFLLLICFTICVDYNVGRILHAEDDAKKRKNILCLSIVSNLTVLCFFKYFNFFIDSIEQAFTVFGWSFNTWTLNIILPVGISFYTFQSMSYVIDIYRKDIKPTNSLLNYATYVSFFPQLVAGPIERATQLLPQIVNSRHPKYKQVCEGLYLIYWGLFKKIFIADNLARIVDPIFAMSNPSSEQIMLATYAFAFQIYCDFSAYTDIARGIGKTMGVELMMNFRLPYIATNPTEFWRRWHISLSTWLRDYLYKPLGGSRGGSAKTYRNLMLTMVLGGLWHGAHANFIIWGFYQGVLLVVYRLLSPPSAVGASTGQLVQQEKSGLGVFAGMRKMIAWFIFFNLMCYGWLIFRASSGEQIASMTQTLLGGFDIVSLALSMPKFGFYIFPLLVVQFLQYRYSDMGVVYSLNVAVKTVFYVSLFFLMVLFGSFNSGEFIYFQF